MTVFDKTAHLAQQALSFFFIKLKKVTKETRFSFSILSLDGLNESLSASHSLQCNVILELNGGKKEGKQWQTIFMMQFDGIKILN